MFKDPVYEIDDDENDLDDKERSTAEVGNATDSHMSEEQEATGSNNEVDIVDESSQVIYLCQNIFTYYFAND